MKRFLAILWVIVTALVALWAVMAVRHFLRPVEAQRATANWPSTAGTIEGAVEIRESFRDGRYADKSPRYRQDLFVPYSYGVGDVPYRNNQTTLLVGQYRTLQEAESAADLYATGASVTVYYNPASPAESVLVAGETPIGRRHTGPILMRVYVMPGIAIVGWMGIAALWWRGRGSR